MLACKIGSQCLDTDPVMSGDAAYPSGAEPTAMAANEAPKYGESGDSHGS